MSNAKWATYRMYYQLPTRVAASGSKGMDLGGVPRKWKSSDITFRARSQEEAQRKADKFWRDAQFGVGSLTVIEEAEGNKPMTTELADEDRCTVLVDLDQRCDNPATMTVREPYTPAAFEIKCCQSCGESLVSQGYTRGEVSR